MSEEPRRECPMCGEAMRLRTHTRVQRIPGTSEDKTIETEEWECPECDYFEERNEDERQG